MAAFGLSIGILTGCGANYITNNGPGTAIDTSVAAGTSPNNANTINNATESPKAHNNNGKTSIPKTSTSTTTPSRSPVLRRTNPMAGVYHPSRLQVIDPFKTVSGTVMMVRHEMDKDYHINIKLDAKYASLINANNVKYEHGDLVVEVIPMDAAHIPAPTVGEHITVTGSYVNDHAHGWMEIHPAWFINGQGTASYTAAAAAASVLAGVCGNGDTDCNDPLENPAANLPMTNTAAAGSSNTTSKTKSIEVVSSNLNVARGSEASVTIQTKPGATGSIVVEYSSGPSKASGLGNHTAGTDGRITWSWKIGTRTTVGDWPVTITVGTEQMRLTLHVGKG